MSTPPPTAKPGIARKTVCAVAGGVLLLTGVALLVLPGPGLLLVFVGMLVLAHGYPAAQRFVEPVERRAMHAAEESVSSPPRIVFSVGTGLVLIVAGVIWWLQPDLPLGGWPTGISLILSGLVLHTLLLVSYRHIQQRRGTRS